MTAKFNAFVPGSLKTWVRDNFEGVKINPIVKNQHDLHPVSCTHHSFALLVETTHKIRWARLKDSRAKRDDLKVDLLWLIDKFPPPLTMRGLIIALNDPEFNGYIRANDGLFHYRVRDFDYLEIGPGAFNGVDDLNTVIQYLGNIGPVLGSFYPSPSYKPGQNVVYVTDQRRQVIVCPECKRPLTLKHAVCVLGTVVASINGVYRDCFVYLESDKPEENSTKKNGLCYMTVDSMDSVTIPVL